MNKIKWNKETKIFSTATHELYEVTENGNKVYRVNPMGFNLYLGAHRIMKGSKAECEAKKAELENKSFGKVDLSSKDKVIKYLKNNNYSELVRMGSGSVSIDELGEESSKRDKNYYTISYYNGNTYINISPAGGYAVYSIDLIKPNTIEYSVVYQENRYQFPEKLTADEFIKLLEQ